jgi:hypothetical protein
VVDTPPLMMPDTVTWAEATAGTAAAIAIARSDYFMSPTPKLLINLDKSGIITKHIE